MEPIEQTGGTGMAFHGFPHAAAFVDYEHWYFSMSNLYSMKPEIGWWLSELSCKVRLSDIYFFGDFSNPELERELTRIRSYTSKIIETKNPGCYKKDFTDFIMLDVIYQYALTSPQTEAYILMTGDAHFNSVAAFLKTVCRKRVGLYGVRGALSGQLKDTVDWWVELPLQAEMFGRYRSMILQSLKILEKKEGGIAKPTFSHTVRSVANYNQVEETLIHAALLQLLDKGYILQQEEYLGIHRTIRVLRVNWDAVERDGLLTNRPPEMLYPVSIT